MQIRTLPSRGYDPTEIPAHVDHYLTAARGSFTVTEIDAALRSSSRFEHLVPYDLADALRFLHATGRVLWDGDQLTLGTHVRAALPTPAGHDPGHLGM